MLYFQTEPSITTTTEEPNYLENEIDDSLDAKDDKNDWFYKDCTMQEYEVMKVRKYVKYKGSQQIEKPAFLNN